MSIKPSWRNLLAQGLIKRTDQGMWARPDAIRIIAGFNLRDEEAEGYREEIESLKSHMRRGGKVPALEVALSADGLGVDMVDGHRRTTSYKELIAEGLHIEWIRIEPFEGNDLARHVRVLTSQESSKLRPLELADGYMRMKTLFGLSNEEIASQVGKSRQHVQQMLVLANAPHAVKMMVRSGDASATAAIATLSANGADAGAEVLASAKLVATSNGKNRVTAAVLRPWTPPARALLPMVSAVGAVVDAIPKETRQALAEQPSDDETVTLPALVLYQLLAQHGAIDALRAKADKKSAPKANALSMEAA